jgi:hemolysin activation/secretion protein
MFLRRVFAVLSLLLLACCTAGAAFGATSGLDVLDRERDRARAEPRSQPKIRIADDRQPSALDSAVRFTLASLHVTGGTVFAESDLLAPYTGLYGTHISFETLNGIAADLTKKYRDGGYLLSRVVLPAQEVDAGAADIRLTAIEGFVSSIEYVGEEQLLARFKKYFSSVEQSLVGKKPLKHADFEREMLLLQDLPGLKVSSRFKEAAVSGASILVLELEQDLIDASVGWSSTGTESAGPGLFSVSAGVNTLPLIGARTTFSYSQADRFEEYYTMRVGQSYQFANGLALDASYAYSSSPRPDTDFARLFDYETSSKTFSLGVSYPLVRSRDMNLSLGMGYEHRDSAADLLDERFTRDRLRSLSVNADFDFSDEWGGVTQIIPTLYQGLDVFSATNHDPEATNTLAGAKFFKADLYVSRNQQLPWDFSLFAAAEGQFSDSSLSSYNKFSFGGSQFGRGFEPGVIEGDNAASASLEPRWTWYLTEKVTLQPFAFVDWGTVWASRSVAGVRDEEHGSSFGGGVRLWGHAGKSHLPDFNVSAFIGKPLQRAGSYPDTSERFVMQFSLFF